MISNELIREENIPQRGLRKSSKDFFGIAKWIMKAKDARSLHPFTKWNLFNYESSYLFSPFRRFSRNKLCDIFEKSLLKVCSKQKTLSLITFGICGPFIFKHLKAKNLSDVFDDNIYAAIIDNHVFSQGFLYMHEPIVIINVVFMQVYKSCSCFCCHKRCSWVFN